MDYGHTLAQNPRVPHLSLVEILSRSPMLAEWLKKSEQVMQLNRCVQKLVDPSLTPHFRVLSFRNNILILSCFSSMWGHKLRFKVPDLIDSLRQDLRFAALKTIQVKVKPEENSILTHKSLTLPGPKLSKQAAALIQIMAKELKNDKLQNSLLRLSKRSRS